MINKRLNDKLIELVVADGSKGIFGSVNKNFINAGLQSCIEHKAWYI
jgi:hypothetical protein